MADTAGPSSGDVQPQQLQPVEGQQEVPSSSSGIVPILQNLVATVNLGQKLTLQTIASKARNTEYNPKVNTVCARLSPRVQARSCD